MSRTQRIVYYAVVILVSVVATAYYIPSRHPDLPQTTGILIGAASGLVWSSLLLGGLYLLERRGWFGTRKTRRAD